MTTTIILSTIIITIGVTVATVLDSSMSAYPSLTGSLNATAYTTFSNVYSAFSLSTLAPILGIAAVIIILIMAAFKTLGMSGAMSE